MDKKLLNNSIIIADYDYFPLLFKFKNDNPELDISFMTPDEVVMKLSGSYKDIKLAIRLLMNEGISYAKAKQYLNVFQLPYFIDNANDELKHLYSLIKDLLVKDQYDYLFFNNKKVFILESKNDNLTRKAILSNKDLKCDIKDITLEQMSINEQKGFKKPKVYYFDDKYWQFFYVFADIRDKVLNDKADVNKIQILVKDETDLIYTDMFSKIFKIKTCNQIKGTLFDEPLVKTQIKKFWETKRFEIAEEDCKNKAVAMLHNLIFKDYELDELASSKGFEFACNNLLEIVKTALYDKDQLISGIVVTNRYTFNPYVSTYVTNFDDSCFFETIKDNDVISDEMTKLMGGNASYEWTLIDKQKKANYIKYHQTSLISRPLQHLQDHIYDSPLLKEFGWMKGKKPDSAIVKHVVFKDDKGLFKNGSNTSEARRLYYANQYDVIFSTSKNEAEKINSYDCDFKWNDSQLVEQDTFSPSSIEDFSNCPFSYFLKHILRLQPEQDMFNLVIGNAIHAFFQEVNHDYGEIDSDKYQKHISNQKELFIKEYKKSLDRNKLPFTSKDEAYIEIILSWLEKIYRAYYVTYRSIALRQRETFGEVLAWPNNTDFKNDYEIPFCFELDGKLKGKKIKGRIDKILLSQHQASNFYTIIDFKTGSSAKFDVEYIPFAKSIQLPLYAWACNEDKNLSKLLNGNALQLGGFGIQRIWSKKFNDFIADKGVANIEQLSKYMKVDGSVLPSCKDSLKGFDSNEKLFKDKLTELEPEFIALCQTPDFNFKTIINSRIQRIVNNWFSVEPLSINPTKMPKDNSDLFCTYCPYRNVCYVNKRKIVMDYGKKEGDL